WVAVQEFDPGWFAILKTWWQNSGITREFGGINLKLQRFDWPQHIFNLLLLGRCKLLCLQRTAWPSENQRQADPEQQEVGSVCHGRTFCIRVLAGCFNSPTNKLSRAEGDARMSLSSAHQGFSGDGSGSRHRRSALSWLAESAQRSSGEKATPQTISVCPVKQCSSLPVATSHSRTVLSELPETARQPSL